jgi:hypothetical protein
MTGSTTGGAIEQATPSVFYAFDAHWQQAWNHIEARPAQVASTPCTKWHNGIGVEYPSDHLRNGAA